jgi:hypothetical protein
MMRSVLCRCDDLSELWDDGAKQYADGHLTQVGVQASGWEVLYRCRDTGTRWIEEHPASSEHGGGRTRLRRVAGWPDDAPLPHGIRVRETSTGRLGEVVGYSQSDDGQWHWAVHMDDDDRVWTVSHANTARVD